MYTGAQTQRLNEHQLTSSQVVKGATILGDVDNLMERGSKLSCMLRMLADSICGTEPETDSGVGSSPDSLASKVQSLGFMLNEAERQAQRIGNVLGMR